MTDEKEKLRAPRFYQRGHVRTWRFWLASVAVLAALAFAGLWIYLNYFYGDAPPPFQLSPKTP